MSELSLNELESEHGELLPERETLANINFSIASIVAQASGVQVSNATQALTLLSVNQGNNTQAVEALG
jgi:hypothetical protein